VIVIIDDVLNSGKHFKVAQSLIRSRYPTAEIRGVFLARCVREPFEVEALPSW
jgi:hypoxanthine-guanine phosphoribosyltransferase